MAIPFVLRAMLAEGRKEGQEEGGEQEEDESISQRRYFNDKAA